MRIATLLTSDPHTAEDVYQETLQRLAARLSWVDNPNAFCRRVMHNIVRRAAKPRCCPWPRDRARRAPPCSISWTARPGTPPSTSTSRWPRRRRSTASSPLPRNAAGELFFAPADDGQEPRHVGTIEPLWNLFDLTREGRPASRHEQFTYWQAYFPMLASEVDGLKVASADAVRHYRVSHDRIHTAAKSQRRPAAAADDRGNVLCQRIWAITGVSGPSADFCEPS